MHRIIHYPLMPTEKAVRDFLKPSACVFMPYVIFVDSFTSQNTNSALIYSIFFSAASKNYRGCCMCSFWLSDLVNCFTGEPKNDIKTCVINSIEHLRKSGHLSYKKIEERDNDNKNFEFTLKTIWVSKKGLRLKGKNTWLELEE